MSRCPNYDSLLEPFVVESAESIIVEGSKHRLGSGCGGDVFECKLRKTGEHAVMKTPKTDLQLWTRNGDHGSTNQRWLKEDCADDEGYFFLFNDAFPSRVLEVYQAAEHTDARLNVGELAEDDRHQKWQLDAHGHLVCKSHRSACITSASIDDGAQIRIEDIRCPADTMQQWSLQPVKGGAVLIASSSNGKLIDFVGETDSRELYYLARWRFEPGVVSLRNVVWGAGSTSSLFVTQRLGRQLGPGTASLESSDCVLRDIVDAKARVRTPAQAARQLLLVACFLRRMHLDGYTHNDLHDGNILQDFRSDTLPFKVIDLGSVTEAGHWKSELGPSYGKSWSVTRDWRAFALHFYSLVTGSVKNIWDLVGTNNKLPQHNTDWAVQTRVNVAANAANGSKTQKWSFDKRKSLITSRDSGKVLDLSGEDGSSVIVFQPNGGLNQKWKFMDGSLESQAKRLKLDICGGIDGNRVIAHEGTGAENQMWHYDQVSGEIVNPASRKVLDVNGEVRFPSEVQALVDSSGNAGERQIIAQLFEALFKARADPNEICVCVSLLAACN